jgi:phospholipid/cholesterol/gamma-HCH transport system permease protein
MPLIGLPLVGQAARLVEGFGRYSLLIARAFTLPRDLRLRLYLRNLRTQMVRTGVDSIPIVLLATAFSGGVTAVQALYQQQDPTIPLPASAIGTFTEEAVLLELGTLVTAFVLSGRVGARIAAELGTMRVTEQLDAMKVMASDPVRVLVVPRFLACVLVIPLLTVISNVCGVMGGWLIITRFYGADPVPYERFSSQFINSYDIASGLIKSVFYGAGIGLIACWKGFSCKPGAQGVGEATTHSFVTSFVTIILMTLVLAKVLNDIDFMIHGGVDSVFR